jgi:cyclophilin family peptidyl-prolyl cis-trans isomerase
MEMKKTIIAAIFIGAIIALSIFVLKKSDETKQAALDNQNSPAKIVQNTPEVATGSPDLKPTDMPIKTNSKTYSQPPAMSIDVNKIYTAIITTSKGIMKIDLFAKETTVTVNNFVFLAGNGFYDNTIFHRIIKGFMIQGGDPEGNGTGGPGYQFKDEPITRDYNRGIMAMANSGPNNNGSQFFIMDADTPLKKDYVIFGAINPQDKASLQTLDAIADTPVSVNGMGEVSVPQEKVTVNTITITEK